MHDPEFTPAANHAAPAQAGRLARFMETWFGRGAAEPADEPFRDSDFESDSSFFGRPLGDH